MTPRVLIVDDDAAIREVAQMSLEMVAGWQTITASSGTEAIGIAAREQPDAILLDVMMPGLDGPQTVGRLRGATATASIPIILLTAKAQAADRNRLAEVPGISGVLAKPFDPMTLADDVKRLLGWPA